VEREIDQNVCTERKYLDEKLNAEKKSLGGGEIMEESSVADKEKKGEARWKAAN
jgi:hypothetical protein